MIEPTIVNPLTGKKIKVGKDAYNKLVNRGIISGRTFSRTRLNELGVFLGSYVIEPIYEDKYINTIKNPLTNRDVKIGGAAYKKLVKDGIVSGNEINHQKVADLGLVFNNHNVAPKDEVSSNYIVLNVETKGNVSDIGGDKRVKDLTFDLCCTYNPISKKTKTFTRSNIHKLDSYIGDKVVVGFNLLRFGYIVLHAQGCHPLEYKTFDIMAHIRSMNSKHVPSLSNIISSNLYNWRRGEDCDARAKCKDTIKRIDELYQYGLKNGKITYDATIFRKAPYETGVRSWN